MNDIIKEKLKNLPELPGSYQMRDKTGKIIYVGKAKNLKNRVRSYFVGAHNNKTTALVEQIEDLTYITCKNEKEAFLLEISLIKEHKPFYNIDLTDDKTYPYIEFKNNKDPYLCVTRHPSKKNNHIFGPYTNVYSARHTMELLNSLYKLRKCKTVPKKKCIYYEMNECMAPCINHISKEEYDSIYKEIKSLLYGNDLSIISKLKKEMEDYSASLDFENAKRVRDLIEDIKETIIKQDVILKDHIDIDVYGIAIESDLIVIETIYVRAGKITLSKSDSIPFYLNSDDSIYSYILNNYEFLDPPDYIYIDKSYQETLEYLLENTTVLTPLKGAKAKLLDMANDNASLSLSNSLKKDYDSRRESLKELSDLLSIPLPNRIESFDNSNLFGSNPVSSMVSYINGRKAPKEYRKYHIKSVEGPNDYLSMKEVTFRRYKRLLDENLPLPDLILTDGGIIQVNATKEVLDMLNITSIKVAGLKKNDKHNTDTIIYNDKEYELDKHSKLYKLVFEIQEEVHRFAITFFKDTKNKQDFSNILDNVSGLGSILKSKLLEKYKYTKAIMDAPDEELSLIGLNQKTIDNLRQTLIEEIDFE